MPLQFVIGRSGSGKSRYCIKRIIEKLEADPFGKPLVLIVPEQTTFMAEHAIITASSRKGMIRAQVLGFRRLAYRVLQETGGLQREPIDDIGKKMLLYRLLKQHRDELRLLAGRRQHPGADEIAEWLALFHELKRYEKTPQAVEQWALQMERAQTRAGERDLSNKLHDIHVLYSAYEKAMTEKYFDADHMLTRLAENIGKAAWIREAEFFIDGFHGFTPQELHVIREIMRHAGCVTVALCLDRPYGPGEKPHELELFYPTACTMSVLGEMAAAIGKPIAETIVLRAEGPPAMQRSPMLARLEREFSSLRPVPHRQEAGQAEDHIMLRAAINRRAEVDGVARKMVELARDHGYRWRDMGITVRNIEDYADLLEDTFRAYDIPYFLDLKKTVAHHPLVEFVRSAWDVVLGGWKYVDVFRCVKTGLFLDPDSETAPDRQQEAIDLLENEALAYGVSGERWKDPEPWDFVRYRYLEDEADPVEAEAEKEAAAERTALMHEARMRIAVPLQRFEERVKKARFVQEYAEALFALLTDVKADRILEQWSEGAVRAGRTEEARQHAQIWGGIIHVLDQMVELLAGEEVAPDTVRELIDMGLSGLRLGLVPPSLDQVIVGSPDRTRASGLRCVFMIGVNDGIYPRHLSGGGLLTEKERDELAEAGFELAPGARRQLMDDQFLMYKAVTAPTERLWISYPLADEEGKALLPSELVRRIKRIFPGLEETALFYDPAPTMSTEEQMEYIAHPRRALALLLHQLRLWLNGAAICDIWWDVYNWLAHSREWRSALQRSLYGLFHENAASPLTAKTVKELYGPGLRTSVTRLELFAACPFAHFAAYGLRLAERQMYRLEAPDIGQLFHASLNLLAKELERENIAWDELTAGQCSAMARNIVERLAPRLQGQILLSSKRFLYITQKLTDIVGRAAFVLSEHARRSRFRPAAFEIGFGGPGEWPPMRLELDTGSEMLVSGRIDRIDRADTADGVLLRVIDYKSGKTHLKLADLYYGLSMQVLVYLDVAVTNAERWLGKQAKPAGALYFHVHRPLLQLKNPPAASEVEREVLRRYQMKGLVTADLDTLRLMDLGLASGQRSDIIPVAVKKDGGFHKHSSVVEPDQWEVLREFVRSRLKMFGNEIMGGRIDIRPYRKGTDTACRFCSYRAVCQFDPGHDGNDYRRLVSMGEDSLWSRFHGVRPQSGGEQS